MAVFARKNRLRRTSQWRRLLCGWALLISATLLANCSGSDRPESIVLIVIDTLRDDHVGGTTPPTPHLDALAARGQRITGAVSSYHQTTMSMASLFTGRTPSLERANGAQRSWDGTTWCGLERFATSSDAHCVPQEAITLAESLAEAGYQTLGVTSNPLLFDPAGYSQGFDRWIEVGRSPDTSPDYAARLADTYRWEARQWPSVRNAVETVLRDAERKDTFLYVHLMEVHDYVKRENGYAGSVRDADTAVGALLELLATHETMKDSLIIVTSDHGEQLAGEAHAIRGTRQHFGNPSFEEVLRVPIIASHAVFQSLPESPRSDDLHRQIAALAGAAAPRADLEPGELYVSEGKYRTYRSGRWKSFDARKDESFVLIDLAEDPREQHDVAREHPEIVAQHQARIEAISAAISSRVEPEAQKLSPDERARLQSLGYLSPDGSAIDETTDP